FYHKRTILLVRHPADVAVSQYFQWRHRMRRRKMRINRYPMDTRLPLFQFVMGDDSGLPKIIRFMNDWARELPKLTGVLGVRDEDVREETECTLDRILRFIGTPGQPDEIAEAARFASLENMRRLEDDGTFLMRSGRPLARIRNNSNHYKAR